QAFGVDFTMLDGNTGDVLYLASDQPCGDWSYRAELCREVARRGSPEVIEEDHPLLMLAFPLPSEGESLVAAAAFLSQPLAGDEELTRAARFLACDVEQARQWAYRQSPISGGMLLRLASAVQARLESEQLV